MSIFAYTKAFLQSVPYPLLSRQQQLQLQEKKLQNLLQYAREHSDYYRDRIPADLDLSKVPPINKLDFIANFDSIVTDKNVTMERVMDKIKSCGTEGAVLDGKYSISMTSGSTGNPTIILQDADFQNTSTVASFFRTLKAQFPIVMVAESGGFGTEASTIKHNTKNFKAVEKMILPIDVAAESIDTIIEKLQKLGPATLIGYTGVMTIMANKLIDKGVTIPEKRVYVSGEKCMPSDKTVIGRAFACQDVRIIYGCTEGGEIAHECQYGHLHMMSDCVKIEPVDENNNPVGYDKLSDKVLLTNLSNRVQPIIRYEVTDRITVHQGCPCGCKDDWLEIEGRANDNLVFELDGKTISVPSISLLITIAEVNKNGLINFKNYQVAATKDAHLTITLDYFKEVDPQEVNREMTEKLTKFFRIYGVENLTLDYVAGAPKKTTRGKYKRVYMV